MQSSLQYYLVSPTKVIHFSVEKSIHRTWGNDTRLSKQEPPDPSISLPIAENMLPST